MASIEITVGEILDALKAAEASPADAEGFFTVTDLSQSSGVPDRTLRTWLGRLKKAGLLEVGRVRIEQLSDSTKRVPAYRLKERKV